jgi:hypothetical protein
LVIANDHAEKGELAPSVVRAREASKRTCGSKERRFKQGIERADPAQREMKNDPIRGSSTQGSSGSAPGYLSNLRQDFPKRDPTD